MKKFLLELCVIALGCALMMAGPLLQVAGIIKG
jgi:hypothetical protein